MTDDQSLDGIESPGSRRDVIGWRIRFSEFGILINIGVISSANLFLNSSLFKLLTISCHLVARQLVLVIYRCTKTKIWKITQPERNSGENAAATPASKVIE